MLQYRVSVLSSITISPFLSLGHNKLSERVYWSDGVEPESIFVCEGKVLVDRPEGVSA